MWRWCLNSGDQPYSHYIRTDKKYGWDKYQPNHLAYRWKVEMKKGRSIKERGKNKIEDRKIKSRNTVAIHWKTCNILSEHYLRTIILRFSQERSFFIFQLSVCISLSLRLSSSLFDQLSPNFPIHFSTNSLFWASWA